MLKLNPNMTVPKLEVSKILSKNKKRRSQYWTKVGWVLENG
jgi:hypothetical protein